MSNDFGLYDYQLDSLSRMHNGCILCGGVGSGKSRTALAYYFKYESKLKNLYIITTAHKRDTKEWHDEYEFFKQFPFIDDSFNVTIDSWNNIKKYVDVKDSYFIFDEQRVVGYGAWTKSFLKITAVNRWILLSATPGDTWLDYAPVFIANHFYKNITDFRQQHVIYRYNPNGAYYSVDRYVSTGKLIRYRIETLVTMNYKRPAETHDIDVTVDYDSDLYTKISKLRWDPWKNEPIQNISGYCYDLRRAVNEADSRQLAVLAILEEHPRAIIFYNYDYELDILRRLPYGMDVAVAELNGHKHDPIPTTDKWVYFVNYNAGAEGWNCITTDTIIFYSLNYSYRIMTQAKGRIDRVNTSYKNLYYYHIKSRASIDQAIGRALKKKKSFNERGFSKMYVQNDSTV